MSVLELLRPPDHRGPLIAAGAVLFTVGLLLEEQRLDEQLPTALHVVIVALAAALVLGLGLQARAAGGRPAAFQSVLLVCGLVLAAVGLGEIATLLGSEEPTDSAPLTVISLLLAVLALYPARTRQSAVCGMIAAVALGVALIAGADWLLGIGVTTVRWLLLLEAIVLVLVALVLRGGRARQSELLIVTAGLATLAIPLLAAFSTLLAFGADDAELLPAWWELVTLAAGCGLIAFGAVDRAPGAAWLGVAHLAAFVVADGGSEDTLTWWPLLLIAVGGGAMAAGLRPLSPLPPEPAGYSVERPLASRADDEEVLVVRNVDPPDRRE